MRMPVLVGAVAFSLFAAYTFVAGQEAVPNLATDKTMFWSAADVQARWKENERLKRNQLTAFQRADQHQRERANRAARRRAADA
jgi:hypothetical protein